MSVHVFMLDRLANYQHQYPLRYISTSAPLMAGTLLGVELA